MVQSVSDFFEARTFVKYECHSTTHHGVTIISAQFTVALPTIHVTGIRNELRKTRPEYDVSLSRFKFIFEILDDVHVLWISYVFVRKYIHSVSQRFTCQSELTLYNV